MFDKTHLPPAQFEFVVISDTHYMLDLGDQPLEFESRRKQSQRAEVALQQVAALNPAFVIHLGDLVQEYPETPKFKQAISEAQAQLDRCRISPHLVAGNHDVGDKTDHTMPTHPTTAESLAFYHDNFGPSWYGFDQNDCHFVVLNSQIFNADLPETQTQWDWVEADLQKNAHMRIFLFFHLPLYLKSLNEPGLGHYDNINPPDRERLYEIIEKNNIELVFSGHVHYPFYDRIGTSRYFIAPSPAFTRPGFGHLFASAPPPEQGRDDTDKLGFYFVRVFADRTDIHFIRTQGAMALPASPRLITCSSAALPQSPMGLTLSHPITPTTEVPLIFPSAVRTPVRNDLHFLSILELGVTSVRFPWRDLLDPFLRQRLAMLKSEGVALTATFLEPRIEGLSELVQTHTDLLQTWEVQLPGTPFPAPEHYPVLKRCAEHTKLALAPVISNERVPGKQHARTRMGYTPEEIVPLNETLRKNDLHLNRILCRVPPNESPYEVAQNLATQSHIQHIDLSVELTTQDDLENANRVAEACFAIALLKGARLFVSPYIDFDRTMDTIHGLLDTLCNPRPAFHVLKNLNTLLFGPTLCRTYRPLPTQNADTHRILNLSSSHRTLSLVLPKTPDLTDIELLINNKDNVYCLKTGERVPLEQRHTGRLPTLIIT